MIHEGVFPLCRGRCMLRDNTITIEAGDGAVRASGLHRRS